MKAKETKTKKTKAKKSKAKSLPAVTPDRTSSIFSRASKDEIEQIKTVTDWVLSGQSMFSINKALEELYPEDEGQRKFIMAGVLEFFTNSGQADTDVMRGWCIEALREIYHQMVTNGDFADAAKVIKDIYNLNNK